jgi:hypothetical protein
VAAEVIGTGTDSGIPYIDIRYSGTPAGSGNIALRHETSTGVAAATAQTWTLSAFIKVQAGSLGAATIDFAMDENTGAGAFVAFGNSSAQSVTTSALNSQRFSFTRTLSGGGTVGALRPMTRLVLTGTTPLDVTLRIGAPVCEQGAFMTSPILTTSAAVTRAVDVATIATLGSWFNAAAGSLVADATLYGSIVSKFIAIFSDNTANEVISLQTSSTGLPRVSITDDGVSQATPVSGYTTVVGTPFSAALAYAVNDFAIAAGSTAVGTDTSGTLPTVDRLYLGASGTGAQTSGIWIRRLRYYASRLPTATLQGLTA